MVEQISLELGILTLLSPKDIFRSATFTIGQIRLFKYYNVRTKGYEKNKNHYQATVAPELPPETRVHFHDIPFCRVGPRVKSETVLASKQTTTPTLLYTYVAIQQPSKIAVNLVGSGANCLLELNLGCSLGSFLHSSEHYVGQ